MDLKTNSDPLTANEQIAQMAKDWPGFCVLHSTPWSIVWRGELRPLCCTYQVQICYYAFAVPVLGIVPLVRTDGRLIRPYVEIVAPTLASRSSAVKDAIPHVFPNRHFPGMPRLCLHLSDEWNGSMAISESIVHWSSDWLIAYEGWRATGKWWAGGHGTERRAA
jgi:hypothetical protein